MEHVRTLKELDYVEHRETILLGHTIAESQTPHGRLEVVGSGSIVRFTLEGHDGYVDLNLDRFAAAAVAWLTRNDGDGHESAA